MKISVIIPSYRRFLPLINTIQDLQQQKYNNFEIIVVDQNQDWPQEYEKSLSIICQDKRIIWLSLDKPDVVVARNMAVQKSQGEILLFIDDDVKIADHQFISNHAENFSDPHIHIVAGRECNPEYIYEEIVDRNFEDSAYLQKVKTFSPLQQALWFNRNSQESTEVCTFSTCNGAIRKSVFLAVGGFDENFSGNSYGDDYDLILRLHQLGYKSIYDPRPWLIHLRVPMGGLRMSDFKNKVNYINTATGFWLFLLRHGTFGMYWHLLYNHVLRKTIFLKVNLQRPWRQLYVIPGVIGAFFRAWFLLSKRTKSKLLICS